MRAAVVNGKAGIVAANRERKGVAEVFILFDGDTPDEMGAGWFLVSEVAVYAPGDRIRVPGTLGTVTAVHGPARHSPDTLLDFDADDTDKLCGIMTYSLHLAKADEVWERLYTKGGK